jgi:hypothetical protein
MAMRSVEPAVLAQYCSAVWLVGSRSRVRRETASLRRDSDDAFGPCPQQRQMAASITLETRSITD